MCLCTSTDPTRQLVTECEMSLKTVYFIANIIILGFDHSYPVGFDQGILWSTNIINQEII